MARGLAWKDTISGWMEFTIFKHFEIRLLSKHSLFQGRPWMFPGKKHQTAFCTYHNSMTPRLKIQSVVHLSGSRTAKKKKKTQSRPLSHEAILFYILYQAKLGRFCYSQAPSNMDSSVLKHLQTAKSCGGTTHWQTCHSNNIFEMGCWHPKKQLTV